MTHEQPRPVRTPTFVVVTLFVAAGLVGSALAVLGLSAVDGETQARVPSATAQTSQPPTSSAGPAGVVDPQELVGSWIAKGVDALDGRMLQLRAGGGLRVTRFAPAAFEVESCVWLGTWSASASGLMVAKIDAASGRCGGDLDAAWGALIGFQRYDPVAEGVAVTDVRGQPIATLRAALVDPADVGAFTPRADAIPLPSGVSPVPLRVLTSGEWLPVRKDADPGPLPGAGSADAPGVGNVPFKTPPKPANYPYAGFQGDGVWAGSDGCNGQGGAWSYDAETGGWLASTGGQTQIFCENVNVSGMLGGARSMGIDTEGQLVFFDDKGAEIGRFVQSELGS